MLLSQNVVQDLPFFDQNVQVFSFFCFSKISTFCRENEIFKKNEQKTEKKKHHFLISLINWSYVATLALLTQPWTTLVLIFGAFLPVSILKPLFL